jgi:tRNA (guanine-N7-)-methyltransferase
VGKGKLLKFQEMESFSNVIQAPFGRIEGSEFYLKGNWKRDFFKNDRPIIAELGCGKGEYTVEMAEKFPDKNFIGVDIKGARMWKGAKMSFEKEMKNVGFLRTNIENINQFFAPGEVDEIWITFPDPQMKKANRRLTSAVFLERYLNFLSGNGVVHLKTDSNFLYLYSKALIEKNNFNVITQTDNLYESDLLNDILSITTYYEKQWLARGIPIKYIAFTMHRELPFVEPEAAIKRDPYRSFGRSARERI